MRLFEFTNIDSILGKAFYFVKMTIEIHNMDFYKLKDSTFHNCRNMIDTYIPIFKKYLIPCIPNCTSKASIVS